MYKIAAIFLNRRKCSVVTKRKEVISNALYKRQINIGNLKKWAKNRESTESIALIATEVTGKRIWE